ncbi:DUF6716 putative glycosyltransferase [Streptomyces benahoarensis]|uniref:Uncharacterized protein n=1 Tax=Streptomyces benahoarensis TaxID=2595054 RepID=A0A553Z2W9_9ACTN|nr:DUF6716 putative glycosyltransferase [Streptomyces benahoarensis]TSB21312.1 hypothetical protein FNJ62_19080 [Streptomyces benahoarensis]TSB35827.1 hypothetical protein FNZ23_20605 [Streptomyces benahoarensis]
MPSRTSSTPRVAVLADSDTRWKWGALTAYRIHPEARLDGYLLRGRATPTVRQLHEVGARAQTLREIRGIDFLDLMRADAGSAEPYDTVVLALVGGGVQAMLHGLARAWEGTVRRPAVVTGYVGVVYEKLADGLLLRHGADVVLANSRHDADRFRAVYRGAGADDSAVTECALPFLGGDPYTGEHAPYTVVFAAQPSVPDNRADRGYLLRRAVEHAREHPDREVLIKLRSKPGEHTTHIEELPYQKLAAKVPGGLPANCRLVYGNMGEVLDRTDLMVTVSSTAALESLHRGVPTAVLTDLGIREVLGNHHFLGSGCLASWDDLDAGHRPEPDADWLARQGVCADGSYPRAFDAVRAKVAALHAAGPLPPLTPYYTPRTAPGHLPGILARHGLDPHGVPVAGCAPEGREAPGGLRRVARDAVREAARGAYRHGVQRVAPAIRRWGQL